MQPWQDLVARPHDIFGKIDFDPWQTGNVLVPELVRRSEQQVADRLFVRLEDGAGAYVAIGRIGEPLRHVSAETEESHRFTAKVEVHVHLLPKLDEPSGAHAELHRFVAGLELAIEQEHVGVPRRAEPAHDAIVVEHVRIHEEQIVVELVAHGPQRHHAALLKIRVEHRPHAQVAGNGFQRRRDALGLEADAEHELGYSGAPQNAHMALEQRLSAELEEALGTVSGRAQPDTETRCEHQRFHVAQDHTERPDNPYTRGMKWVSFVLFSAGLAGLLALLGYYGFADVGRVLASGAAGIVVVTLFHLLPMLADTLAWRWLLPRAHRGGLGDLLWMRWICESVNTLFPVAQVGGDVVRARLANQRGLPAADAAGTMIADLTTSAMMLVVFGSAGALLLWWRQGSASGGLFVALAVSAAMVGTFYLLQRAGLFSRLAWHAAQWMAHGYRDTIIGGADALDRALDAVYMRRADVLVSCACALGGLTLGAGEVWLALHFLGVDVGIVDAFILESLIQALRGAAFAVPGAVGVQEVGFVALGAALGLDGGTALALSLIKRARELVLGLPGLVAWQVAEGRRFLRKRGARADAAAALALQRPEDINR